MNRNFILRPLPRVYFGPGTIIELPAVMASLGKRVLLIMGQASFGKTAYWPVLRQSMTERGLKFHVEHISGEPSPEIVDFITEKYRNSEIGAVVAIGGGSVLDGGKAVSAMLAAGGSVIEYLEGVGGRKTDGDKIPFIAVPTTSGTGSEMTSNAVISRVGKDGFKKSLRHDNYIPDVALIDPELTLSCPPRLTKHCAMDAFSQLVESYLSTKSSPFTDDLAFGALRKVKDSLMEVCQGGGTIEARCNMSYAAAISGITLTNAGLGVIHGFASVIGGLYAIPHGMVCGTLMAAGNEITLRKLRKTARSASTYALGKYAALGRLFSGKEKGSDEYYRDSFISTLQAITTALDVEPLSDYGIGPADVPIIAGQSACKNNPVALDQEEMEAILSLRIA
jgi:alcohol dehydrogenase